ncbi:SH3 domain-containing protein [Sulfurimonas sp.]
MKLYYIIVCIIVFSGCTQHSLNSSKEIDAKKSLSDVNYVYQDVSLYSEGIEKSFISTQEKFEEQYFRPWRIDKIGTSKEDAMWAYKLFNPTNSYGENLQPISQKFFDDILENSNFSAFSTLNRRAITLKELNIRAFPTQKPVLRDPSLAGEGFPFDYMQNSTIAANKPIFVSHYSKDREWVFIEASFAYGWVKARDIVFIKNKYTEIWQEAQQAYFIKDDVPIYANGNRFLFKSKVGLMLPIIQEGSKNYKVLTISNFKDSQALFMRSNIPKKILHKGILKFTSENINNILNEVSKVNYGWGGIYGQRDCSSILRDFFTPFGIWLPRNSFMQSKVGKVISLENMSNKEKIKTIKKYGVAFETLLYKKGHIVLYVGTYNDEVIIFHNTWGIKTKKGSKEGRYIIGKPIFSTLELGDKLEDFDEDASILTKLKSMNILTL